MLNLLRGVRVLDLTTVVLGPYATQMIGDFGADVIKLEPPAGDVFRYVPPGRSQAMGAGYLNLNRNKRTLRLNLKTNEGYESFCELLLGADVLVHNMRANAAEALGIGYETVKRAHPGLVYCSAPGFGEGGTRSAEPAYDDIIQAASGLAAMNANAQGEPRFLPTIVCDKVGGLHLALAILAGIVHRERQGRGCRIEVPMFESMVSFLMVEQMAGRSFLPALGEIGYERLLSPYRKPFQTADGFIAALPYSGRHWKSFLTLIEREDLATADWVLDSAQRSARINELYKILDETMPMRSTAEWITVLRDLDIPCSEVTKPEHLTMDAHLEEVGLFSTYEHPTEGDVISIRSPFRVTGVRGSEDHPPERLAEEESSVAWLPRK